MTTIEKPSQTTPTTYIGQGVPRRDGLAKATGTAKYTFDVALPDMVFGTLVSATIPHGRVDYVDHAPALALPGVLLVLSSENQAPTPPLAADGKPYTWFNREIVHDGQDVAFVVATTQQIADEAAGLIIVTSSERPFAGDIHTAMMEGAPTARADGSPNAELVMDDADANYARGDVTTALAEAATTLDLRYELPPQTHNPWEAHVTVAQWDGDSVTVYDSVQYPMGARRTIAGALGIAVEQVRVITEHVGGAFGSKLSTRSQAPLAALAARLLQRPVRARLTRAQMNRVARQRPALWQTLRIGADADGHLTAIDLHAWSTVSPGSGYYEGVVTSRFLYACPNVASEQWRVFINQNPPGSMRAPGEMQSQFALETAMDELAHTLKLDPIELRRRNMSATHPVNGKPWSRNSLMECLEQGAQQIGWQRRASSAGSLRDGPRWRGLGCAAAYYPLYSMSTEAEVAIIVDGRVLVKCSAVDLGTGTYTVMAQVAADGLGAQLADVTMLLGDTDLPKGPMAGGSMTVPSAAPAVHQAAQDARQQLIAAALALPDAPFAGLVAADLTTSTSYVYVTAQPSRALAFAAIIQASGIAEIVGKGAWKEEENPYAIANFGAQFAEVEVDVETGIVSVLRIVAVHDSGRVLNAQTFRSQLYGGIIWGISNALMEETHIDARRGRVSNANLADYLIPTSLDIGQIDVSWLDEPDYQANPLGIKSVGEIGITGIAPAIGNAIFNATGVRLRKLPFRPQHVLSALLAAGIEG